MALPPSFITDTDVFIDYLNGIEDARVILDSPGHTIYYAKITRKELLGMPGLSISEQKKIITLLQTHRMIPLDQNIAAKFSELFHKYSNNPLRNADALVAATAWDRNLPLLTRNKKHYKFILEINLLPYGSS